MERGEVVQIALRAGRAGATGILPPRIHTVQVTSSSRRAL
jgi:hypothetical protein